MKASYRLLFGLNTLGFIAVLVVNYLSNSLPLNGKTPGELSDLYTNLFVPAGLTFSIWGVIYLWLLVWTAYQLVGLVRAGASPEMASLVERIGWWFLASCLFNIAWLFAWHWQVLWLSVLVMLLLLAVLLVLNIRAGVGNPGVSSAEKWLAHLPFGIYQGWITLALIANVTAGLVSLGWDGFGLGEPVWAVGMILVGAAIAVWMLAGRNNLGHGLAVAWGLYGIYVKRSALGDAPEVAWAALIGVGVLLVVGGLRWRRLLG